MPLRGFGNPEQRMSEGYQTPIFATCIAVAPYEMYDTNGMFIKENSPKKMTFVATCSNGGNGYFPSKLAFQHPGYEVDITKYAEGSAEQLADLYVGMLKDMSK